MSKVSPKRSIRYLFGAGALFILAYGTLQPATGMAQPADGSRVIQSAWNKLCFNAPYAQSDAETGLSKQSETIEIVRACFTYTVESDEPTAIHPGIIGVLQASALDRIVLVVFLGSSEVFPRTDAGYLHFPDGAPINLLTLGPYACDASGCYARAELSSNLLEQIKAAKALTFEEHTILGGAVPYPLACCGFAEAFAGQSVHPSAYDEMRRRIIGVLVTRFHDFMQ
jgi:hypothetical protein